MAAPRTGARWWSPSPETIARMESPTLRVRYDEPPLAGQVPRQFRSARRTQITPPGPGLVKLRDFIVQRWGIRQTWTPGRSRPMTDRMQLDTHQSNQAFDLVTNDPAVATEIAAWLIEHADAIGLQCIIAFGNRWYSGRRAGERFRKYEGVSDHTDHLHIELNRDGAAGLLSWYAGRAVLESTVPDGVPPIGDGDGDRVVLQWVAVGVGVAVTVGVVAALVGAFQTGENS